ncbi:MAG: hypothetical protein ACKV2T_21005 [Kofleriaceae bacterium]
MKATLVVAIVCAASAAHAEKKCLDALRAKTPNKAATAQYWDGTALHTIRAAASGEVVVYFHDNKAPAPAMFGLTALPQVWPEDQVAACTRLRQFEYSRTMPSVPDAERRQSRAPSTIGEVARAYRQPRSSATPTGMLSTVGAEAVQILGQIVVDRASTAAYALLSKKVQKWLGCKAPEVFKETCDVVGHLRLQDLAMAPDQLRAALAKDAWAAFQTLIPHQDELPPETPAVVKAQPSSFEKQLHALVVSQLLPALGVPVGELSGNGPEAVLRAVVDRGLALIDEGSTALNTTSTNSLGITRSALERQIDKTDLPDTVKQKLKDKIKDAGAEIQKEIDGTLDQIEDAAKSALATNAARAKAELAILADQIYDEVYCDLGDYHAVLSTVALAFAACTAQGGSCSIMQKVDEIDGTCADGERMTDDQRAHARSIAGHVWDAATLDKGTSGADRPARLIAALEASFDIACMYASPRLGPYACSIAPEASDAITHPEKIAVARDVILAAARRDGAALAASFVRGLVRITAAPKEEAAYSRGMRVLSTIAAYAATYTGDATDEEAHAGRTELLESLTKDMTVRTARGGDTIWSVGGSLRAVIGGRIGRSNGDKTGDTTIWTPLSVPLGFGIDSLWEERGEQRGFHVEIGILDLGQYLSWEEGPELAEPEIADAFSPSLTVAVAWGWEIPIIAGFSAGYTPAFDFGSQGNGKRGAFNVGFVIGAYVPLFDFN